MKTIIRTILIAGIVTNINLHATDKSFGYEVINACNDYKSNTSKYDSLTGVLSGLGQAYITTIRKNGIDNNFASLSPGDFAIEMCKRTLEFRQEVNKRTGGKYDVTQFYYDLIEIGYYMTLPPSYEKDKNATKK